MTLLSGGTALITGASGGIGRATAEEFIARGADHVFLTYSSSEEAARATVDELTASGGSASAIHCDIADAASVAHLLDEIRGQAGRLDYLVNNAATTEFIPLPDLDAVSAETWERLFRVNVLGAFEVSRAAADLLRAARGAVVNVASIAGRRATGSSLPYGVTKAAMLQLTRMLAISLAPEVRVNSVSPGTVRTEWHGSAIQSGEFEKLEQKDAARIPLGGYAKASDVADAIVGLVSMRHVTGQDVIVDGGRNLSY